MGQFVINRVHHEERAIREYVESQAQGETVTHAEKVRAERLRHRKVDGWDVRTDNERYWVITNPTNLYLQSVFPSLDYTISLHIGLTERVWARQAPPVAEAERRRLAAVWRRWTQAAEALDAAEEIEEFQAVGMRCRECLLAFVKIASKPDMVPAGEDAPKTGDFIRWSELIAERIATGASLKTVRGYLKAAAKETWQLVGWLTHSQNATRMDADIALDATQNVLVAFGLALVRLERGATDRCPACGSSRLVTDYGAGLASSATAMCDGCGWVDPGADRNS